MQTTYIFTSCALKLAREKSLVGPISLTIKSGSVYALVGESGSGKTLTALAITRLLPDNICVTDGMINIGNHNILSETEAGMNQIRGKTVAMVFQNAMTALNPVMTIGNQLKEALKQHKNPNLSQADVYLAELLIDTGLPSSKQFFKKIPSSIIGRSVTTHCYCHGPLSSSPVADCRRANYGVGCHNTTNYFTTTPTLKSKVSAHYTFCNP